MINIHSILTLLQIWQVKHKYLNNWYIVGPATQFILMKINLVWPIYKFNLFLSSWVFSFWSVVLQNNEILSARIWLYFSNEKKQISNKGRKKNILTWFWFEIWVNRIFYSFITPWNHKSIKNVIFDNSKSFNQEKISKCFLLMIHWCKY